MKKLFSIALCVIMLCAAVLPMTVSAAGVILMEDTFDVQSDEKWDYLDSHFQVIDGRIEGYADAVVHQSNGFESLDGHMAWGTGTCYSVDCWLIDNDSGTEDLWIGTWWSDYFASGDDDDVDGTITYSIQYHQADSTIRFLAEYKGEDGAMYKPADIEEGENTYEWFRMEVPQKMDSSNPVKFNLGFRVNNGVITCYLDNKLFYTHNCERGTACGTNDPSPFLLWNHGGYTAFDNVVVATADYNLFNESAVTEPVVTEPATSEIVTELVTELVTKFEKVTDENGQAVTDENGKDVTEVVTEIVTKYEEHVVTGVPSADTHTNNGNGNGGAQTGDMFVIVAAVMVVALGAAIVVKKVND